MPDRNEDVNKSLHRLLGIDGKNDGRYKGCYPRHDKDLLDVRRLYCFVSDRVNAEYQKDACSDYHKE